MGDWMKLHGRVHLRLHRRRPTSSRSPTTACSPTTRRRKRLYVHVLVWPMGKLRLDGIADKVEYAQLLNDASELRMSTRKDTTWIARTRAPATSWCGCRSSSRTSRSRWSSCS